MNTDPLTCPITNRLMHNPYIANCGHTFNLDEIMQKSYCPLHEKEIDLSTLRPDPLCREITFRVLLKNANRKTGYTQSKTICLAFTPHSRKYDYSKANKIYEWTKRIGGFDLSNQIPLICPISRQIIFNPVKAPCFHSFEKSSIPKDGICCPFDGEFITHSTLYPHNFVATYIDNILEKEFIMPRAVRGVYLKLDLNKNMSDLGDIAKRFGVMYKASKVNIWDGYEFLPDDSTLAKALKFTPNEVIPYFFTSYGQGYDFSHMEREF